MDVADHAAREHITFGKRRSGDREPIAAAGDRADGLERGADHILVRRIRSGGVGDHGLDPGVVRAVVLRLEFVHDRCPCLAESPQASGFEEEVIAQVQAELDAGTGLVDGEALCEEGREERPALFQVRCDEQAHLGMHGEERAQVLHLGSMRKSRAQAQVGRSNILPFGFFQGPFQCTDAALRELDVDRTYEHVLERVHSTLHRSLKAYPIGTAHQAFQELVVRIGVIDLHCDGGPPRVAGPLHSAATVTGGCAIRGHVEWR